MADSKPRATTPFDALAGHTLSADGISIDALPLGPKLNIRGKPTDAFSESVSGALDLALPLQPNRVSRHSGVHTDDALFWLGPDEWLWRGGGDPAASVADAAESLRDQWQQTGHHCAVVDVSDFYAVLQLSGSRVFEVLSKGTPLDCVTALCDAGCCAQTRFGHANVLLDRCLDTDDAELCVNLQVRWSFVEVVWRQLQLATEEFAPVAPP
ncbi:MAG: hypothetical protein KTR33_00655 [Gammaproteobacteria bacterium]|nr:hypothetical protein [Gammaproteobacteria bacterium]